MIRRPQKLDPAVIRAVACIGLGLALALQTACTDPTIRQPKFAARSGNQTYDMRTSPSLPEPSAIPAPPDPINLPFTPSSHPGSSLKIARNTPDYLADGATRSVYAGGQPNFTWDGQIRLVPTGGMTVESGTKRVDGIAAMIVDYDAMTRDASGRTVFAYKTGNPAFPNGVPLYRQLNLGVSGPCAGQKLYEIPFASCGSSNFRVMLDEPDAPAVGTGLTYPWHFQVLPDQDYAVNPFPSDPYGNAVTTPTTYRTYRLVYVGTVVMAPEAGDPDYLSSHPYFTNGSQRDRLVTGLGRIVVDTSLREGKHAIPTRIVSANLFPDTFSVVHLQGSAPGAPRIARGIEPTAPRYLDLVAYQSYLAPTSPMGDAGVGHVFTIRKLQGSFRNPRCRSPEPGCQELLFSNPETLAALHTHRDQQIPGASVTYGQRYPIARYKLATPTLDKVYGEYDYFGMAYPWISPEGDFLLGTNGFGMGDFLDRNPTTLATQTSGGIEYCLFSGAQCDPHSSQRNIRREAYLMYGTQLIANNGTEDVLQGQTLDSPLNEWPRTLARVTAWSPGIFDGLWGLAQQNPVSRLKVFKSTPGTDILPLFISMNNNAGSQGAVEKLEFTSAGQVDVGMARRGYLFYTGFANVGDYVPVSGGLPFTGLRTNMSKTQDVSGNNLNVALQPGVYYPFNDPVGNYSTPPLLDNARQLQIGRVGQGVYCSLGGQVLISEQSGRSRPKALSSYKDRLSFQAWIKPLAQITSFQLAKTAAFSLSLDATRRLTSTLRADAFSHTVTTAGSLPLNEWTHIVVDYSPVPIRSSFRTRIHINGKLALDIEGPTWTNVTQLAQGPGIPWALCNPGSGAPTGRALILDEVGIAPRLLADSEIRTSALLGDPRTTADEAGLRARLGFLGGVMDSLGIDVNEAHVPVDNPVTLEKFSLGQKIFFDPNLSSNRSISCASCHVPSLGYGSPGISGKGMGVSGTPTQRAAPRIVNLVFGTAETRYNADERSATLEAQFIGPFTNPAEMGMQSMDAVLQRIKANASYAALISQAFPSKTLATLNELEVRMALATFVRMLVVGDSPYDRFRGGNPAALTDSQRKGYGVFVNNCIGCHSGHALSNTRSFNIGAYPATHADRGKEAITGNIHDAFAFKTPGLRDLHLRRTEVGGPQRLGHDGQLSLDQILASYMAGGTHPHANKGPDIRAISLSPEELTGLKAFLNEALVSSFVLPYTLNAP